MHVNGSICCLYQYVNGSCLGSTEDLTVPVHSQQLMLYALLMLFGKSVPMPSIFYYPCLSGVCWSVILSYFLLKEIDFGQKH